jgi:anti-anti-sigma factor
MPIELSNQGAVTVLKPVGPLTDALADELRATLDETIPRTLGRIVLDASAIPLADSLGLEALADAADRLSASGQSMRLVACTDTLREALELTDLAQLFEHYADVHTAVRSFL